MMPPASGADWQLQLLAVVLNLRRALALTS
jgi:hypothetical protein